jgi:hypothetical protein
MPMILDPSQAMGPAPAVDLASRKLEITWSGCPEPADYAISIAIRQGLQESRRQCVKKPLFPNNCAPIAGISTGTSSDLLDPVWPPVPSRLCASRRLVGADEQRGKNGISNAGAGHVEIYAKIK